VPCAKVTKNAKQEKAWRTGLTGLTGKKALYWDRSPAHEILLQVQFTVLVPFLSVGRESLEP
jgi:hypothetical protein